MNKKLIALAIAGALGGTVSMAQASDMMASHVTTSGFIDGVYTLSDEASDNAGRDASGSLANTTEQKWALDGEVDVMGGMGDVKMRVDLDITADDGAADSADIEQAFASWGLGGTMTLNIGQMNSPLGFEAEDAPGLYQTSHGQIYSQLDGQSSTLSGNNIRGVTLDVMAGPVNLTFGLLNDLQGTNENSSLLISADTAFMHDMINLELGILTQDDNVTAAVATANAGAAAAGNPNSAENIIDLNGTFSMDNWFVGVEVVTFGGNGAGIAESALGLYANMEFGGGFAATVRLDSVSYNDTGAGAKNDSDSTTLAGIYEADENLLLLLEWRNDDSGGAGANAKTDAITFEVLGTF